MARLFIPSSLSSPLDKGILGSNISAEAENGDGRGNRRAGRDGGDS